MNVFYADPGQIKDGIIDIEGQEARHISKVLRYDIGQQISVVDGIGNLHSGAISRAGKDSVQAHIESTIATPKPRPTHLALGLLKNRDRLEFAVEKAVELGATAIHLFEADHGERARFKIERLQTIMVSAMKQSLRRWLPNLHIHKNFAAVLEFVSDRELDLIVCHEKQGGFSDEAFRSEHKNGILIGIGPEGGFSDAEIELAVEKDAIIAGLGTYRLRAETAVITALSLVLG